MALATVTLMVGIMSISAATLRMHHLSRQNRERTLAHNAVHAVAERINSASAVAALAPSSWTTTVMDAYGPGGTVGNTFDVLGLTASEGHAQVGSIVIITDETKTDAELGVIMGMPRDLNGDGDANDTDVTGDARMLGVIITADWRGEGSAVTLNHPLYIMGY
ncbi:MAG: hypothetical protein P1V81_00650 [Planctomycetota bacterium]|nr:hypothetical protein [Planctomycetota bacterium]